MWTTLSELPPPVRHAIALTLLVLLASVTGCAATSTPSEFTPKNPSPPPSTLTERSQSWSSSAQQLLSKWRQMLTEAATKP